MVRYDSYKPSGISWIGEIPSHWESRKIRSLYALRSEKVSDKDFEPLSVSKQGITPQLEDAVKTDNGDNRKLVRVGDFVVNSRSDRKGACGVSQLDGSVSLINIVTYPITQLNSQYYHLLFRSNDYIEEFYRLGKGIVADLWTTKYDEMRNIIVPFPPLDEQKKIVEFLSTKTSLIDAQQREIERELRLLDELKQAEIANVVTRGLNPDVPMKHAKSLLGDEIPQTWSLIRMRNLVKEQNELVGDRTSFPLLSLTKGGVILRDVESGKGKFPKDFQKYKVVVPDNIIFCLFDIDETPRTVGLSSHNGMITGAYDVFSINEAIANKEYLYYYFLAVDHIKALRPYYTGLRKVVQGPTFLGLQIPIPPIEEQKAIVEYIQQKNTAIDEMIANLGAEIDFLTEYKQRLIADVVTGQIKVD